MCTHCARVKFYLGIPSTNQMENPVVVQTLESEGGLRLRACVEAACAAGGIVALDIEGVDLGRTGEISVVQLAFQADADVLNVFVVDILSKTQDDPLVETLKLLLEEPSVIKVIHDCRMDSDALQHKLGITLVSVHDTSCFHQVTQYGSIVNINNLMTHHGLPTNAVRDSSVYRRNHAFWATRPLTPRMIEWAGGDVAQILQVRELQLQAVLPRMLRKCESMSLDYVNIPRSWLCATFNVRQSSIGRFIGRGGATMRALEKRTKTKVYSSGSRGSGKFVCYHESPAGLASVRTKASSY